jgi:hypothetical protein
MKLFHAIMVATFCTFTLGACLDAETDETDSGGSGDPEDGSWECVPFVTCDSSSEESESEDPEDGSWECIPFVTC